MKSNNNIYIRSWPHLGQDEITPNALKELTIYTSPLSYTIYTYDRWQKGLQPSSFSNESAIFLPIDEKSIANESLCQPWHVFTRVCGEGGGEKRVTKLIYKLARFSLRVKKKKKKNSSYNITIFMFAIN